RQRESGISEYVNLTDVTYGNGTFVTVGQFSTPSPILTSTDGATWIPRRCRTVNSLNGVSYGLNHFIAVGDGGTILQSGDVTTPFLQGRYPQNGAFEVSLSGAIGRVLRIQYSTRGSWAARCPGLSGGWLCP